MLIHSLYNLPPKNATTVDGLSMTQQHFKEECDINNIIAKYKNTGFLVDPMHPGTVNPMFDNFSNVTDFQSAQVILAQAQQSFDLLPASLRKRFNNDPEYLLQFLEKEENRNEAINLGLISRPATDSATTTSSNSSTSATT